MHKHTWVSSNTKNKLFTMKQFCTLSLTKFCNHYNKTLISRKFKEWSGCINVNVAHNILNLFNRKCQYDVEVGERRGGEIAFELVGPSLAPPLSAALDPNVISKLIKNTANLQSYQYYSFKTRAAHFWPLFSRPKMRSEALLVIL